MVKNYRGAREESSKTLEKQNISVRDHMATNLIKFSPNQTIEEAIEALTDANVSGGPVVNAENELVGVISEGDCLKGLISEKYYNHPSTGLHVKDCMVENVISILPEVDIFEAGKMFLDLRIRRFPVLDNQQKVIGQISQKDVILALKEVKSQTW